MKRDRYGPRQFHELACAFDIDDPVCLQQAKHHSIHPAVFGRHNTAHHFVELRGGITKIPAARPDHRKNWNVNLRAYSAHQLYSRSHSSNSQVFAELDSVRSATFPGDRRIQAFDTDFQYWIFLHGDFWRYFFAGGASSAPER